MLPPGRTPRCPMDAFALRAGRTIALPGLRERGIEIAVALLAWAHVRSSYGFGPALQANGAAPARARCKAGGGGILHER